MYGVAEFEPLWDAAQHAPEEHLRANRSSTTPVRSAAANETAPAASRASIIRLPPVNEVARWLAALVDRDGDDAVVAALLQSVPGPRMMAIVEELCVQRFGIDPILCDDRGQVRSTPYQHPPPPVTEQRSLSLSLALSLSSLSGDRRLGGRAKGTHGEPRERASHEDAGAHVG